jgi:glutamine amidotransferase
MQQAQPRISTKVGIVDVGIANLGSISAALSEIAETVQIVRSPNDLKFVDRLVLPGVGAFPVAMERLCDVGLDHGIRDFCRGLGKPTLGICLGMQLMAGSGEEHGVTAGLNLIEGRVRRFRELPGQRVPHVGWNDVTLLRPVPLFQQIPSGTDFYFVHSYVFEVEGNEALIGTSENGEVFAAVVHRESALGVQFHPEKSSQAGRRILRNFCEWSPC